MLIYTDTKYRPKRKPKVVFGPLAKARYKPDVPAPLKLSKNHLHEASKARMSNLRSIHGDQFIPEVKVYETEELRERERIAQEANEKLKKRVAPLVNKGAYQYITPDTDLKTLGR